MKKRLQKIYYLNIKSEMGRSWLGLFWFCVFLLCIFPFVSNFDVTGVIALIVGVFGSYIFAALGDFFD